MHCPQHVQKKRNTKQKTNTATNTYTDQSDVERPGRLCKIATETETDVIRL